MTCRRVGPAGVAFNRDSRDLNTHRPFRCTGIACALLASFVTPLQGQACAGLAPFSMGVHRAGMSLETDFNVVAIGLKYQTGVLAPLYISADVVAYSRSCENCVYTYYTYTYYAQQLHELPYPASASPLASPPMVQNTPTRQVELVVPYQPLGHGGDRSYRATLNAGFVIAPQSLDGVVVCPSFQAEYATLEVDDVEMVAHDRAVRVTLSVGDPVIQTPSFMLIPFGALSVTTGSVNGTSTSYTSEPLFRARGSGFGFQVGTGLFFEKRWTVRPFVGIPFGFEDNPSVWSGIDVSISFGRRATS